MLLISDTLDVRRTTFDERRTVYVPRMGFSGSKRVTLSVIQHPSQAFE